MLKSKDVKWVVNNYGELGVEIGNQCFFLYKGESLQYSSDSSLNDDNQTPITVRSVRKREFGEVCKTPDMARLDECNDWDAWRNISNPNSTPEAPIPCFPYDKRYVSTWLLTHRTDINISDKYYVWIPSLDGLSGLWYDRKSNKGRTPEEMSDYICGGMTD